MHRAMFPRTTTRVVRARPRSLTLPTMLALSAVLLVVAGMFATLLLTTRSLDATSKSSRRATQIQQESGRLERSAVDLETGLRGDLITRDRTYLQPYDDARASLSTHIHQLLLLSTSEERRHVMALRDSLSDYVNDYAEPLLRSGRLGDAALREVTRDGKRRLDAIRAQFAAFNAAQTSVMDERRGRGQHLRHRILTLAAAGSLVSALLLLGLMLALNRMILDPVRRVAGAARRLAAGGLDARVPEDGFGEIRQLGFAFNTMASALAAREEDLRVQTDRLQGILDHTTTSISVKDREGRYLLVNAEGLRRMGLTQDQIVGRT